MGRIRLPKQLSFLPDTGKMRWPAKHQAARIPRTGEIYEEYVAMPNAGAMDLTPPANDQCLNGFRILC